MTLWLAILSGIILLDAVVVWCALVLSARADRRMQGMQDTRHGQMYPGPGVQGLYEIGADFGPGESKTTYSTYVAPSATSPARPQLTPAQLCAVAQARARNIRP